ncbi:hypothetical protein B0T22DRAFT_498974 [Podospora appendiculata]|uniref:MARVEL domain-containing protein n=1 Tax=Podospora appendiculata TaxID=314037 RepID=A0AAE1CCX1_9PEZI|nr:hypothetical protein B0T22DRAFT_498974 [Podospora appendiculata]
MRPASRIAHVILRVWELMCSIIVVALLGRFLHLADEGGAVRDSRIVYGVTPAAICLAYTLLFGPPIIYAFLAFPADFILFATWMTAFGLLIARTGTNTCSSPCQCRTVLAFSFLAGFAFLISCILGAVVVVRYYRGEEPEKVP